MDWYLDARDTRAGSALRRQLAGYLARHGNAESDLAAAELVLGELIANAVQHAPGPCWVHVDWSGDRPRVDVHDLGPGFEPDPALPEDPLAQGGRGLWLVNHLTGDLAVAAKRAGGNRVSAVLPVVRDAERSHDPRPSSADSLPAPEEASTDGSFGRESFLRALVVQLARAVDEEHGPDAAQAAVAQVGADVGGRMEEEYRRVRGVVGRLDPEQIADLYVRLKAAIDGDFYVISLDEERIVLGNRRCPFGEAVKRAPGLCRMTSSVFGGIAARNTGDAAVALEERIAVGDPECRVVVWLGPGARAHTAAAHLYRGDDAIPVDA